MSDPDFISMTIDGKTARVPRSSLDEVMKRLDAAGIPFDAPVGPAPSGAPAAAGPAPQAPREQSPIEWLATTGRRGAEGLYDGAVGLSQGMSLGGADELMGMMPGTSIAQQQAIRDAARARSPVAYDAANAAGSLVPAALTSGLSAAEQLGGSLVQGGLGSFLGRDGGIAERSKAGNEGIAAAALLHGAGSGAGSLASPLANAASAERAASLSTASDFKTLAHKYGIDYTLDDLAAQSDRMGLNNAFLPQGPRSFASRAGDARNAMGAAEGAAMDDAAALGARGDRGNIVQGLNDLRSEAAALPTSDRKVLPNIYKDMIEGQGYSTNSPEPANRFGPGNVEMSPRDIHTLKKQYESKGGFVPDAIRDLPQGLERQAYQDASAVPRAELDSVMQSAGPDLWDKFNQARQGYGYAAALENLANERVIQNRAPLHAGIGAGLAGSGAAGAAMLGMHADSMPGAVLGGLVGGAGAYAAGKLARNYGPEMAANTLGLATSGAQTLGGMPRSEPVGGNIPGVMGASAGPIAEDAINWLGSRGASNSDRSSQARQVMDEGKGQNLEPLIKQILQTNPQQLGQYAPQLQEAMQSEDPMRLTGAISALWADPQFRQGIGMQLMQQTRKMR